MFIHPIFVFGLATLTSAVPHSKRAVAFFDPNANGGSMLDDASGGSSSPPLGEPLNVIISGLSSTAVLTDSGFLNFARAIGFSSECLGIHLGGPHTANLGDGNGSVNQAAELRQDYGDSNLGTCLESLIGGNHFRIYRQNGPQADSGALFLAASKEKGLAEEHTIAPNGYNIGRDLLVANAIATSPHPTFNGVTYSATLTQLTGLLPAGSAGVNHGIATDGITSLLTVAIL
ncbi:hypothetical protein C8J57DRAFT_1374048 [Mycena rebaudengoi]|nr:hypothetical protein C8J57DRAFT_1374048 [Mycena rebaudengoi]